MAPGEIGTIELDFDAWSNTGHLSASLEIASNDPDDGLVVIDLMILMAILMLMAARMLMK